MKAQTNYEMSSFLTLDLFKKISRPLMLLSKLLITYSDYKGFLHTPLDGNNCCYEVRNSSIGYLCERCDAYGGLEAARMGKPFMYRCHMGAVEVASPIIIDGHYIGSIYTGQAKLREEEGSKIDYIIPPIRDLSILSAEEQTMYQNHNEGLQPTTLETINATSEIMFVTTTHIAEVAYRNMIEKQLTEYDMNLLKERSRSAELEKNIANLKLLHIRAQVNPHFLFNTLNTISQQAILEGADETPRLIGALAGILRKTLHTSEEPSRLREEVEYIKNYLHIVKSSMRDRISVQLDIDESCLDGEIPIFTIQPLIENALVHGIELSESGGSLLFTIRKKGNMINISINDTGVGMSADVLRSVLSLKQTKELRENKDASLGIQNSIWLLSHYFQDSFSWDVRSAPGKGTEFTLRFPYRKSG